ncbi:signal transduction histidine kinase [Lactobacillus colini]|uniref:histidine kinase n=1 Tax=Lactobacillus colini TaxID=1819254 RepID=A0ABS4MER2_9LACO|nr:HAMP domain-containing sensor histidine kinase [Lactobacillus colini]MBP2057857.1 signal transduction histidine kinase [Lactobacillus colini]
MKLFYQQMLAFLLIIVTSIAIIGYSALNFATNQAYEQSYQRLEGYARSLESLALEDEQGLNHDFLSKMQVVMQGEDMSLRIFNNKSEQVYPETPAKLSIPKSIIQSLKRGKVIKIKNDHEDSRVSFSNRDAYTSILYPWRQNGKFIGILWIGSRVQNVEETIKREKRNLVTALLITLMVGLVLSFILSYFISNRVKRLSKATKKIAQGNFNVHLNHGETDEIDDLAHDFNLMVSALKQSHEEIKAQEQRRDQFMADAAHEMRTPLTTINGILEGLQYNAISEADKPKSIALMQSETRRLIRLVNENLDYEKIRSNKLTLLKTKFNAFIVLSNLLTQMKNKSEQENDSLVLHCPEKIEVYADRDRFTQIMVNLVQNALQFTKNGTITISGHRIEHGTQFSVRDTGIGMNEEQKRFIFDRFYKADASRAKLGSGESGLGLAIVSSLIKQHGGKIEVDSQPNLGSTFTVTLYDEGYEKYQK